MSDRAVTVSKFLALHLRHAPERIGLELDEAGWVDVDELLSAAADAAGFPITRAELDVAVAEPVKRRYAYDESGTRIRAVQGHSVAGVARATRRRRRRTSSSTARSSASWNGSWPRACGRWTASTCISRPTSRPRAWSACGAGSRVILRVDAGAMAAGGAEFFRADNGVWLVAEVPPSAALGYAVSWTSAPSVQSSASP